MEPVQPTQLTAHHEVRENSVVIGFEGEVDLAVGVSSRRTLRLRSTRLPRSRCGWWSSS
jgi:hypothetical protein